MTRARKKWLVVALALGASIALLARSFASSPLPPPAALDTSWPVASPPADMSLHQLPTGVTHRSAGFAYRGGSFRDQRDFVMTAVLVKHPRGDVLIDTGFGRDIDRQFALMPFYFRMITSYERTRSAAEQLDAVGYDRKRLRGVVLTHAHWDHVSGMSELSGTPVLVNADERAFIHDGGVLSAVARNIDSVRYELYDFTGGPYLGFPKSHDVYGDGSIVIVPAPGHTPGSVIVFVTLPSAKRYAFVGDLAWQREGITELEERPWLVRTAADTDADGVRDNLRRMAAVAKKFPELVIAPAHDARGFADLPRL